MLQSGYNMGSGCQLQYSNLGDGDASGFGENWLDHSVPRLSFCADNVIYEEDNTNKVMFTPGAEPGTYEPNYFVRDMLYFDEASGIYTLKAPDGSTKVFSSAGELASLADSYGNEASCTYEGSGEDRRLSSMVTTDSNGDPDKSVSYIYGYSSTDSRNVESITLRVGDPGSSDSDVRQTTYHRTPTGDLERVTLREKVGSDWMDLQTSYHRYHPAEDVHGVRGLMKFTLGNDAVLQMLAAGLDPGTASDAEIAPYADAAYTYYTGPEVPAFAQRRVQSVATHGGRYTSNYQYFASGNDPVTGNVWVTKTVIQKPDGSTQVFYFNSSESLLLQVVSGTNPDTSVSVWYPVCQQFDDKASVVLQATSAAVATVDETSPTLFALKADGGQLTTITYDEHGNRLRTAIQNGTSGVSITLKETSYLAHTVGEITLWFPQTETVYRTADGTGAGDPITTTYSYEWWDSAGGSTGQVKVRIAELPAVPETENGDGVTATVEEHYDIYGFLIEELDALGVVTSYKHDLQTGAVVRMIEDAGTGRLNLTTDYEADALGRTTLSKGPEHTISLAGTATSVRRATWTQYLDSSDEVRTIQGYVQSSDDSEVTVNPVQIQRSFAVDPQVIGGRMTESISAVYGGSGVPPKTSVFTQADYARWSTQHIDQGGEQTHSRVYHSIPASGSGNSPDNYAQTDYGYDSAGRQGQVTSPEGTIQKTVFNAMGWQTEGLVGTSPGNLVTTVLQDYDGGADRGDGNLTEVTQKVDGDTDHDRIQDLSYDWRNRQVLASASDGTRTILSTNLYDNRGNITQVDEYQTAVAAENLINCAQRFFDTRNRPYRTKRFGVDITDSGALKPALTSETYYDQAGRAVRKTPAGKVGFSVNLYDAVGRMKENFHAFGPVPGASLPPGDISTATVLAQSGFTYDAAGNQIATETKQRFDDATGTGALGDPSTEPKARVSYSASYPDPIGRTQAQAYYGTNGGAAWTRPDTIPSRSDTVLVASFVFDDAGNQTESTDPMGTVARQEFNQAGRRVTTVENYIPGGGPAPDLNKTTRFAYNLDGNLTILTAENPTTGNQVTQWIYGVTLAQGSQVESKSLVYQKVYPDSTGAADRMTYTYNRQAQPITVQDQAGTAHGFSFDKFGRVLEDAATAFGTGVDKTVRKITRGYEVRGMLAQVSSLGTGGTVRNEVRLTYNAYAQLAQDWQAHNGAVDSGTLKVEYAYADGSANTVRPTGITYPDGATTITTAYGGTAANALSRPDALKEDGATLCSYRYLGSGVIIGVNYNAAGNVELTFRDGGTGDGGDPYTGLDRFGQLIETVWKKGSADRVRSQYGRNRFGGITWRRDDRAHTQGVDTEDNYYTYDGLYQVQERQRGDLTGTAPDYTGITNLQQEEDWTYDATGNWRAYDNTNPTNAQTRTHNKSNEITQIAAAVGNISPAYDPAGNMLTLPRQPGLSTSQSALKWDAWNRLVSVKDGSTTVASYTYDGLTRRLTKTNASETRNYYYNDQWRAVEERVENASVTVDRQYTWGLRDRWDLLRRKRSVSSSLDESLYVLRDYLDPVAIVNGGGAVVERYTYDAFGNVRILAPDYSNRSVSTLGWDFLFHAELLDADTGLYNYGYRYYSLSLGRWLSRDPIGERGGFNLFCAFSNRPTMAIDVNGLSDGNGAPIQTDFTHASAAIDASATTTTVQSVIDQANKQFDKSNCCLRILSIGFHSGGKKFTFIPTRGLGGSYLEKPTAGQNPSKATQIDKDNAATMFATMAKQIKFCKPCYIYLLGCNAGLSDLPRIARDRTGCIIFAPKGYCDPDLKNPWNTNILKSLPTDPLAPKGLPALPGADGKFLVLPPPVE